MLVDFVGKRFFKVLDNCIINNSSKIEQKLTRNKTDVIIQL